MVTLHINIYINIIVRKNSGHHPLSNHPERQSTIQAAIVGSLNRELTQFESDMLVYPRLCMTCLNGLQVCHFLFNFNKLL